MHLASTRGRLVWAAGLTMGMLVTAGATFDQQPAQDARPTDGGSGSPEWQLLRHEPFGKPLPGSQAPWVQVPPGDDHPWDVGPLDDNGKHFEYLAGDDFADALGTFKTLRKSFRFGEDGWLTAQLSTRNTSAREGPHKSPANEDPPSLTGETLPHAGRVARLSSPDHDDGILITSTRPLPPEYRIEYTLTTVNFGGKRAGEWNYDGRTNGYDRGGCKTTYPWKFGHPDYCDWQPDVRNSRNGANGFYYLGIVDYDNPAPHNNAFIHAHRKAVMDGFNTRRARGIGTVCNPSTGEYYLFEDSNANAVNALFLGQLAEHRPTNAQIPVETECSGQPPTDRGPTSAVELQPKLMPRAQYQFAIERTDSGYTLEMSGNFRYVGQATYRYQRDFVEDGQPIWHYNNTPEEYDGRFNEIRTYGGAHGSYTYDIWPSDSAYPDHFILGDPHMNWYEGEATVDDIKLYVPKDGPGD